MATNGWNIARFSLIAALAVTGYLLLMQWPDYQYIAQPRSANPAADITREAAHPTLDSSSVTPLDKSPSDLVSDDLPSLPTSAPVTTDKSMIDSPFGRGHQLVTIHTDALNVVIDLQGGDVIQASLPQYPVSLDQPDTPFVLLSESAYRYSAQSGILDPSGYDLGQSERPLYQANQREYRLQPEQDVIEVPLFYQLDNGVQVVKSFRFERDSYRIEVSYQLENQGQAPWVGSYFAQLKRDQSPDAAAEFSGFALPTYLGTAYWTSEKAYNKLDFGDIGKASEQGQLALNQPVTGGWLAIIQHYFLTAWIPPVDQTHQFTARQNTQGDNIIGFISSPFQLEPGETWSTQAQLYVGPKLHDRLEATSEGLDLAIDYGLLFFISHGLMQVLIWINQAVGNWGVSIILLTCLVKLVFYYPSAMSYRSMARMRKVQPKMMRLKELYGQDKQRFSQEMIKLYQKESINPVGGCLPMLLQMPVFFALYWALVESVELRQAPFLGWVNDLSAMDPYFILPLLMGVSMFIQMKLNPTPPDPMQAKVMQFMPIVFTVMFLFFPAGLVLYWLTNNILSIAQQWWITRAIERT